MQRWLGGAAVFALTFVLVTATWLPMIATGGAAVHAWWMFFPPALVALGVAAVCDLQPWWLGARRLQVRCVVVLFVVIMVLGSVGARQDVSAAADLRYHTFIPALEALAAAALVAVLARAGWQARTARPLPRATASRRGDRPRLGLDLTRPLALWLLVVALAALPALLGTRGPEHAPTFSLR